MHKTLLQDKRFRNGHVLHSLLTVNKLSDLCETLVCQYEAQVNQEDDVLNLGIDVFGPEVGVAKRTNLKSQRLQKLSH